MRARTVVAAILVLAPSALCAQRIPLPIGRRGPGAPQPLPPQPYPVAAQLAYTRSHLSIETYPMVSVTSAPGIAGLGRAGSWTSLGVGSHADYRLTRFMSGSMDLTSSFYGGPVLTQTVEVGTRFNSARDTGRWYPYLDFRVGYIAAYTNYGTAGNVYVDPSTQAYYGGYSHGFGGIVGAGLEYALTRTLSLTTGASVFSGKLTNRQLEGPNVGDRTVPMTSLRYTLGLRFNPVHNVYDRRPAGERSK